jgi:hypothetical protein
MEEQDQNPNLELDLEFTEEAEEAQLESPPPGAFYAALCKALKQLERQPMEYPAA